MMKKGFKRKEIQVGAVFLISLLLMGSILVVGASRDDYSVENFYVNEDTAWMHAREYLTQFVADELPGLEDWDGAQVEKKPVTVYDIHGKKLFYEFTVTKEGRAIGEIEIAASKVLGSSLGRVILRPPLDRETAAQKAMEVAEKEYHDYKIQSTKPVCYSYPKEGVMVTLAKPEAKEEKMVIIDVYSASVVPLKEPEKEGELGAWSIYDKLSAEERAKGIEKWDSDAEFIADQLSNGILDNGDRGSRGSKTLSVPLYAQQYSNYCAAATGQMIAKYYGTTHSQSYVAGYMGLTPGGGGANDSAQLNYYHSGLWKYGSHREDSPSYSVTKSEINANRPLKSGVPGHARCCRGYYDTGSLIYINDPYGNGYTYWEPWSLRTHTIDIHVKDY
ncbi:MAG TPA: hypothetical protein HA348_02180 [Thermoplasmata archaeon]|nr:hypothetical protein [Thermoplasmata archaeon]